MSGLHSTDPDAVFVQRLLLLKRIERRASAGGYLAAVFGLLAAAAAGLAFYATHF